MCPYRVCECDPTTGRNVEIPAKKHRPIHASQCCRVSRTRDITTSGSLVGPADMCPYRVCECDPTTGRNVEIPAKKHRPIHASQCCRVSRARDITTSGSLVGPADMCPYRVCECDPTTGRNVEIPANKHRPIHASQCCRVSRARDITTSGSLVGPADMCPYRVCECDPTTGRNVEIPANKHRPIHASQCCRVSRARDITTSGSLVGPADMCPYRVCECDPTTGRNVEIPANKHRPIHASQCCRVSRARDITTSGSLVGPADMCPYRVCECDPTTGRNVEIPANKHRPIHASRLSVLPGQSLKSRDITTSGSLVGPADMCPYRVCECDPTTGRNVEIPAKKHRPIHASQCCRVSRARDITTSGSLVGPADMCPYRVCECDPTTGRNVEIPANKHRPIHASQCCRVSRARDITTSGSLVGPADMCPYRVCECDPTTGRNVEIPANKHRPIHASQCCRVSRARDITTSGSLVGPADLCPYRASVSESQSQRDLDGVCRTETKRFNSLRSR